MYYLNLKFTFSRLIDQNNDHDWLSVKVVKFSGRGEESFNDVKVVICCQLGYDEDEYNRNF